MSGNACFESKQSTKEAQLLCASFYADKLLLSVSLFQFSTAMTPIQYPFVEGGNLSVPKAASSEKIFFQENPSQQISGRERTRYCIELML